MIMVTHSAETDFVNGCIKSPTETIDFMTADDDENGFNEFSAISELLQKNLDKNGSFLLNGIGTFTKDSPGEIRFAPITIDPVFSPSLVAERVTRQEHATHAILVGDQQTTNVEMTEYFSEKQPSKDRWWVWAIVLGAIGIGVLLFYFFKYGFRAFGNVSYW